MRSCGDLWKGGSLRFAASRYIVIFDPCLPPSFGNLVVSVAIGIGNRDTTT